jgi:hypothetical protein
MRSAVVMQSKAEQVRVLAAAGVSAENISVRVGLELYEVHDMLAGAAPVVVKRKRGRPRSAGCCQHCGAKPSAQARR